jgi:hypothetical protein
MGHATILHLDGRREKIAAPDVLDGRQRNFLLALENIVRGHIEYVHVLYEGRAVYMIVNETGAVQHPPLKINKAASLIYHNNWCQQNDMDPEDTFRLRLLPSIHGTAVLLHDVEVR